MSMRLWRVLSFLIGGWLVFSSASCSQEKVFQVRGVVKEVLPEQRKVRIEHEKIPNYMDAMTMTFDVKDAKELTGIQTGDRVSFRMIVTEKDGWIDQLKKTRAT